MYEREKKFVGFLVFVLLLAVLLGCPMYTAVGFKYAEASGGEEDGQPVGTDPDEFEITEEEVTLAWDAPSPEIDFYRLVFRIHGANPPESEPWYIIEENVTANPSPEYTVNNGDIGNGLFDFGVVAKDLDADTEESALHSSLDTTAQPDTGWFLIWNY